MSLTFAHRLLLAVSLSLLLGCSGQSSTPISPQAKSQRDDASPTAAEPAAEADTTAGTDQATNESAANGSAADATTEAPSEREPAAAETAETGQPSGPYWPRFHGPRGDNVSSDTGLLKKWPDEGPPLDWTAEGIGNGYSSVSLAHGLIYTAGNIDGKTMITALDLEGNIRWQVENGDAWKGDSPGTRGTPTIDGDHLYHQSPLGNLICVEAKTGEPMWAMNTLEAFEAENIQWALSESLLIDGDHVICCPGGKQASVVAINKSNGEVAWITPSTGDKAGYGSASIAEYEGIRMIFTMTAKAVIGVDADTGRLLFRDPYETDYDVNAFTPLFHDGRVFVSTGYGGTGARLLKLNVQGENVTVEHQWESNELDNHHGGVLLVDGYLYGAADRFNNAKWICLNWQSGEKKWEDRAVGKGSLTCADGLFYLYSERRRVGLAQATPEGMELISQFEVPPGGSGSSWAHPVVCGARLYLRYDDRLHAYNVRGSE